MLKGHQHLTVRSATTSDASALVDIFQASWRSAYTGIIPHRSLTATLDRRNQRWWTSALRNSESYLILEFRGQPAGYANFGNARKSGYYEGEIFELYLAPLYQGLGFGEHLFEACRANLDELSKRGLIVWVLKDNHPAREFYAHRGGRPRQRRIDLSTGTPLEKLAYVWSKGNQTSRS
ncbi:MAG: GNAT family N-acetyltransferase [Alphaproteobacteria bacterium]|nr:GNAT family N-acetyltransferase [Alphaproteobacteria bacterium]